MSAEIELRMLKDSKVRKSELRLTTLLHTEKIYLSADGHPFQY